MKRGLLVVVLLLCGCFSRPDVRYYQLRLDESALVQAEEPTELVFAVESMIGDSAYEDPRIVYRSSPYRLDYYHYHRWTAPPGVMVSDFLRDAYAATGYFDSVVSGFSPDAVVFLSGRIVAFEEVDLAKKEWEARVKMNLFLRDAASGDVVWSRTVEQQVPVQELNPEGVAQAMSTAVTMIVADTAPEFSALAKAAQERVRRRKSRESAIDTLSPESSQE